MSEITPHNTAADDEAADQADVSGETFSDGTEADGAEDGSSDGAETAA